MSPWLLAVACSVSLLILSTASCVFDETNSSEIRFVDGVRPACFELPDSPNPPCARREQWEIATYPEIHGYFDHEVLSRLPLQVEDEYRKYWTGDHGLGTPQVILRGTVLPGSTRCSVIGAVLLDASSHHIYPAGSESIDEICHFNIAVNEYIVGGGPSALPVVAGWRARVVRDVDGYGSAAYFDQVEAPIRDAMEGIEFIFDLRRPHNMAYADWEYSVQGLWDVQRKDDGEIVGVSMWGGIFAPISDISDFEHPLQELQNMMRAAHRKLAGEFEGRIGNSEDSPMLATDASRESLLAQLRELGAYDVPGITPVPAPPAPIPPVEPGELTASPPNEAGGIPLSWTAPDYGNVTSYKVVRRVPKGEFVTVVADTGSTDTMYTDTSAPMTAGVTYIYRVLALNEYGESLASNRATVELPGPDAPADFTATNYEGDVVLTWTQPGVIMPSCYRIYRRAQGEQSFEWVVNCWSAELRSWRDDDVVSGTRYIYRIVPLIGSTESGATARASVRVR